MARVKFSPIISDISGSIGSATFQKGEFGSIVRNKPRPRLSATALQLSNRGRMMQIHKQWSEISANDRFKWDKYIAFSNPRISRDVSIQQSGHSLFIQYQFLRLLTQLPFLTAIRYSMLGDLPHVLNITLDGSHLWLGLTFEPHLHDLWFVFKMSNPRLKSQSYNPKGCRFMYIPVSDAIQWDIASSYIERFGVLPAVGDGVHYSLIYFHVNCPLISHEIKSGLTIVAP